MDSHIQSPIDRPNNKDTPGRADIRRADRTRSQDLPRHRYIDTRIYRLGQLLPLLQQDKKRKTKQETNKIKI